MDQQRVVGLFSLIKVINFPAYQNLIHPSPISETGKDPIEDKEFNKYIRVQLMKAIQATETSMLVIDMENYYRNNKYDALPATNEFNKFMQVTYPEARAGLITPGVKYQGLTYDQRVYFGLFMAFKRELKFN